MCAHCQFRLNGFVFSLNNFKEKQRSFVCLWLSFFVFFFVQINNVTVSMCVHVFPNPIMASAWKKEIPVCKIALSQSILCTRKMSIPSYDTRATVGWVKTNFISFQHLYTFEVNVMKFWVWPHTCEMILFRESNTHKAMASLRICVNNFWTFKILFHCVQCSTFFGSLFTTIYSLYANYKTTKVYPVYIYIGRWAKSKNVFPPPLMHVCGKMHFLWKLQTCEI